MNKIEKIKSYLKGAIGAIAVLAMFSSTVYALSVYVVPQGGTGRASFSPNSILTSGTTATGALVATSSHPLYVGAINATSTTVSNTLSNDLLFRIDNTDDIGASGATRPRNVYFAGDSVGASGSAFSITSRFLLFGGGADGVSQFTNSGGTDFTRLVLGSNDANGIAIKKNSTSFNFRLGNDSADASMTALNGIFSGSVGIASTSPASQLSVGAGGGTGGKITCAEHRPATSTTPTINWRDGCTQLYRHGGSATTFTFSNYADGDTLKLIVCNPGGTGGAITWPAGILWSGGTAPTQTTTANKCDIFSFISTQATSTLKIFGAASTNF